MIVFPRAALGEDYSGMACMQTHFVGFTSIRPVLESFPGLVLVRLRCEELLYCLRHCAKVKVGTYCSR